MRTLMKRPLPAQLVCLQLRLNPCPHLLRLIESCSDQLLSCTNSWECVNREKPKCFHCHHLDHICNTGSFTDPILSDEMRHASSALEDPIELETTDP